LNINLSGPSTFVVSGIILLYIQWNIYNLFRDGYKITRSKQLRVITYAFLLFILATTSMLIINIWAILNPPDLPGIDEGLFRKISIMTYNSIFSIGLLLLLLSTSEKVAIDKDLSLEIVAIAGIGATILSIIAQLTTNIQIIEKGILATNIIVLLESTFLMSQYILYSEKEVITGRLWTLGILMIMFSRGVDILPEKPVTELFLILTDTVAFLLLFLMKKEAEIQVKR